MSSFGIGGTNAHVVLEEAPAVSAGGKGRKWQVLPLSARSQTALEKGGPRLAEHLRRNPGLVLADVAHTLQTGRKAFPHRRAMVAADSARAADGLTASAGPAFAGTRGDQAAAVVFMFPGQDAQFPGMAEVLYRDEPLFRAQVDRCAATLREKHGIDLAARLFSPGGKADPAFATDALPLFVLEYSLAQVWLALGVRPQAMLGYSLGEYVCACLAGVMTLEEALALEVAGSRLLAKIIPGALLAVSLGETELRPLLGAAIEIAMVMAPRQCIVGGSAAAVAELQQRLQAQGTVCMLSQIDLPFHTSHMAPFVEHYRAEVRKVRLQPPRIPYVSCVTGDWITAAMATDPEYYMRLGRDPVYLTRGLQRLFELPEALLLEVGPGQTISGLALLQSGKPAAQRVFSSLCDPRYQGGDAVESAFPTALARLWAAGVDVDWSALYTGERRLRLGLPTYAFDHRSYWIGARATADVAVPGETPAFAGKQPQPERWFHVPAWRELPPLPALAGQSAAGEWLLVGGKASGAADLLAARLQAAGARVQQSEMAAGDIATPAAWDALLTGLIADGRRPDHIVHLGLLGSGATDDATLLEQGYHALIAMGQAVGRRWFAESLRITLVADRLFALGETAPAPA
ncbi:MAG: acyltransferase domain-containing protein, partial [Proteobacteria bacterium]|nr:acyltransferase domain-containing protein [Pseudomonadota bacterium]